MAAPKKSHATLADRTAPKPSNEVEVVVFHNPAKRKKEESKEGSSKQKNEKPKEQDHPVFDMASAKYDARKLGISKLKSKRNKIEAQLSLMKDLGAKIPKNWERKMERKKRIFEMQRHQRDLKHGLKSKPKVDTSKSKNKKKDKKPRKKEEKGNISGEIGKYRSGVQYLSKDDIKKILGR